MINKKMIGPALAGVNDKYSEEWLLKWIKNSAELIASGDPDAIAIWEEYNKAAMPSFLHLSDDEVRDVLAYIEVAPSQMQVATTADSQEVLAVGTSSKTSDYFLLTVCLTLLLIVAVLWKVKNLLKSAAKEKPEDLDFINLARLINRYTNFLGEVEIKNDLEKILKFWKISKNELFSKTKNIWSKGFRPSNTNKDLIGSGFDTSN